jgi:hypothetical protein
MERQSMVTMRDVAFMLLGAGVLLFGSLALVAWFDRLDRHDGSLEFHDRD